ncbi:hypothetical protein DH2020_028743 [Rehmannia glutinosa]|uniref:Uncharacterized protein n=1 Tax=Rehmannia glutinosa TaxID=99300 RepID=A0ABR0VT60_REHGL
MSSLGSKGKEVVGAGGSSDGVRMILSAKESSHYTGVKATRLAVGIESQYRSPHTHDYDERRWQTWRPYSRESIRVTGDQLSSIVQNAVNILWARKEVVDVVEAERTEDRVAPRREEEPMSELEKLQAEVKEMKKRMSGQDVVWMARDPISDNEIDFGREDRKWLAEMKLYKVFSRSRSNPWVAELSSHHLSPWEILNSKGHAQVRIPEKSSSLRCLFKSLRKILRHRGYFQIPWRSSLARASQVR